jgi:uncharacterized membrane protein YjdF
MLHCMSLKDLPIMKFVRQHPALAIFVVAYVAAAGIRCAATGNNEFLLYVAQVGVLATLVIWAHQRANFGPLVLWSLGIWGFLHLAGGTVPVPPGMAQINDADQTKAVLYGFWFIRGWFKYDNLVHCFGFFAATLAVARALEPFLDASVRSRLALWVIICTAGMGLGATNEMIEFAATVMFPETNVGDYRNNALDLCWNALGAAVATTIALRHRSRASVAMSVQ